MRLIVEIFGRVAVLQLQFGKSATEAEHTEEFEQAPVDPHSVHGGQVEQAPQGSACTGFADPYGKFGFHGRQV